MKKLTDKEFKARLACVPNFKFKQIGKYEHSQKKIMFSCSRHGEFAKFPGEALKGVGCPACSRDAKLAKRKADLLKEYTKTLDLHKLVLIDDLKSAKRLKHRCLVCKSEFLALKSTVVAGSGCPSCNGRIQPVTKKRYTDETFRQALLTTQPKLELKTAFMGLGITSKFKCCIHGTFERNAGYALKKGCPSCIKECVRAGKQLSKDTCQSRINERHGDKIRLLGQYVGCTNNRKYRFKCYVCFNTWKAQLHAVMGGTGCPHCANQRKAKAGFRVKEFERDGVKFRVQGWEYQAICWILEHKPTIRAADILTESSSKVPVIRYKFGRRFKNYYPDIFIPRLNIIVEVKSNYTLGLTGTKRSAKMWRQNQAKAKATIAAGFRYRLLVMREDGTRIFLPTGWYNMKPAEVLIQLAMRNGDFVPPGTALYSTALSADGKSKLKQDLLKEKSAT